MIGNPSKNRKFYITRKQEVIARWESEDEIILFDSETERVEIVNEAGLIIWHLCDGTRTRSEIHEEIESRYIVDEGTKKAIDEFIDKLLGAGFLKEEEKDG